MFTYTFLIIYVIHANAYVDLTLQMCNTRSHFLNYNQTLKIRENLTWTTLILESVYSWKLFRWNPKHRNNKALIKCFILLILVFIHFVFLPYWPVLNHFLQYWMLYKFDPKGVRVSCQSNTVIISYFRPKRGTLFGPNLVYFVDKKKMLARLIKLFNLL